MLAAGRGSRLGGETAEKPKCLAEVGGRPLIDWQIAALGAAGLVDIHCVGGYRADMLPFNGTRLHVNEAWASTNMVESLFCAADAFDDDIIVSYSDIVYEPQILTQLLDSPHDISVVVDTAWRNLWSARFDDPLDDAETLRLDGDGRITEIGDKPNGYDNIEAQYIGLCRFRGTGIRTLRHTFDTLDEYERPWMQKRGLENAYMTDFLMEMILRGDDVHATPVEGGWFEVDTETDLALYGKLHSEGALKRFVDPGAVFGKPA